MACGVRTANMTTLVDNVARTRLSFGFLHEMKEVVFPDYIRTVIDRYQDELEFLSQLISEPGGNSKLTDGATAQSDIFVVLRTHYLFALHMGLWTLLGLPLMLIDNWTLSMIFGIMPIFGSTSLYLYRHGILTTWAGSLLCILLASGMHLFGQSISGGSSSIFAAWMHPYIQVLAVTSGKSMGLLLTASYMIILTVLLFLTVGEVLPNNVMQDEFTLFCVSGVQLILLTWAAFCFAYMSELMWEQYVSRLEEVSQVAVQASHAKSTFLAVMSHELRTPLNHVLMVTDVLEQQLETRHNAKERGEGTEIAVDSIVGLAVSADNPARNGEADEDENDADVAQLLSTMRSSACHLLDIINDLLDLSKIESGRMELIVQPTDVVTLVESAVESFAIYGKDKGLEMSCAFEPREIPMLLVDAIRFRQVLFNLLGNAVKFTTEGRIDVAVEYNAELLTLTVVDTGPGMTSEQLDRLFQPYSQVHSPTSSERHEGTGLGLLISKNLAQMMHGDMSVTSEKGRGSSFTLTLRVQAAESIGSRAGM